MLFWNKFPIKILAVKKIEWEGLSFINNNKTIRENKVSQKTNEDSYQQNQVTDGRHISY